MKTITAVELKKRLDKKEVLLVDVRQPVEHQNARIESSCLIPLGEIRIDKLPSVQKPIVVYCAMGKRSATAAEALLMENPALDVASLEGGIMAWDQAGYPIKKSPSGQHMPLYRQTQIAAGCMVLFGVLMGAWVSSKWYVFSGMIGAGLIFSGITGWCGTAMVLAKMPWNQVRTASCDKSSCCS